MPVVGEAIVRVRVISDRLGNDIGSSVRRGFAGANRDIDNEGRSAGQRAGRAAASGVDDAAPDLDRAGKRAGERVGNSLHDEVNKRQRPKLNNLFKGLGGDLTGQFNLGIGAARMGRGIISALVTAGPSILSGAAAIGTSMAAEIITALSAIGPGIAGALGVAAAGVASLALSGGLLYLAFKASGDVLKEVGTQFTKLKEDIGTPIAQGMLAGVTNALANLRDNLVPQIRDLLESTGNAFGTLFEKLSNTLTSGANVSRLRDILTTNTEFINSLGDGLSGLVSTFLTLFKAAKPFVDYIGNGIKRFGEWAAAATSAGEANGSLQAWMQRSLDKFKELASVIADFGRGIWNVFKAAAPVGADLMASLGGIGERFVAWTSDEGNMARMTAFFEKAHTLASKVFEILGKAFAAGGKAFENMNLDNILHVLDTLANSVGPGLAKVFNEIQAGAGANLVVFFDNLGVAINKIADSGIIETVARGFSTLMAVFSGFLASDMGAKIAGFAAAWFLFGGVLQSFLGVAMKLGMALAGLSAPVLAVIAVVAAAVAIFVEIYRNSEKFREAIGKLVDAVGGKFMEIWDALLPKLEILWQKIEKLAGVIGDRLAPIIEAITPTLVGFFDILGTVLNYIVTQVGLFIDFIADILSGDWAGAWDAATTMVGNFFSLIGDLFTKGRLLLGSLISGLGGMIIDMFVAIWNGVFDWTQQRWNEIYAFFDPILTSIADAIRNFGNNIQIWWNEFWTWVGQLVVNAWNGMIDFLSGAYTTITGAIMTFGNNIQTWWNEFWTGVGNTIRSIWDGIIAWATERWNGFTTMMSGIFNGWIGILQGFWDTITGAVHTAWDGIGSWFTERWNGFTSMLGEIFGGWGSILGGLWDRIASIASTAWGIIYDNIVEPIKNAFTTVQEWINRIGEIVRGVLETVTNAYNTVATKLSDTLTAAAAAQTAAAGTQAFVQPGTGSSNAGAFGGTTKLFQNYIAQVTNPPLMLAAGGTIRATPGGVHAIVGEARRDERVEPLAANGMSTRDMAMIEHILKTITSSAGGVTNVSVRIGERELEDVVKSVITEHDRQTARRARNARLFA